MSEISFNGPVTVSPELMMALWNAMPPTGQGGVAQLFFSRFVTDPISEPALVAAAKVFYEREKVGTAAAKALRDGVAAKCRELGEKTININQVQGIIYDETRKAAAEFARTSIANLMSAIPIEALIAEATPAVAEVIKACAHHYFTKSQQGQQWLLELIEKVCDEEAEGALRTTVLEKIEEVATPVVNGRVREMTRSVP